jgi:hypothetical protein
MRAFCWTWNWIIGTRGRLFANQLIYQTVYLPVCKHGRNVNTVIDCGWPRNNRIPRLDQPTLRPNQVSPAKRGALGQLPFVDSTRAILSTGEKPVETAVDEAVLEPAVAVVGPLEMTLDKGTEHSGTIATPPV